MRPTARLSSTDTRATNISRGDSGQISQHDLRSGTLVGQTNKKGICPELGMFGKSALNCAVRILKNQKTANLPVVQPTKIASSHD